MKRDKRLKRDNFLSIVILIMITVSFLLSSFFIASIDFRASDCNSFSASSRATDSEINNVELNQSFGYYNPANNQFQDYFKKLKVEINSVQTKHYERCNELQKCQTIANKIINFFNPAFRKTLPNEEPQIKI